MNLVCYFTEAQKELFTTLKRLIKGSEFQWIDCQLLPIPENERFIWIVLSQPDQKTLEKINQHHSDPLICHIGVRDHVFVSKNIMKISCEMDLNEKLQAILMDHQEQLKRHYLQQLRMESEDLQFIENYSAIPMIKNKDASKIKHKKKRWMENATFITVIDSPRCAKHLAQHLSKKATGKVLLIDGNLLKPSMDTLFDMTHITTPIKSHLTGIDNTGLNLSLDVLDKGLTFDPQMDRYVKKVTPHLHLLLGNYNMYNYEHYDEHKIKQLLDQLKTFYQVIVLNVGSSLYDVMTMIGLHMSNINVFVTEAQLHEVRYQYNAIKLLNAKQGIPESKNVVLAKLPDTRFLKSGYNPLQSVYKSLFRSQYIGSISESCKMRDAFVKKIVERTKIWD